MGSARPAADSAAETLPIQSSGSPLTRIGKRFFILSRLPGAAAQGLKIDRMRRKINKNFFPLQYGRRGNVTTLQLPVQEKESGIEQKTLYS